METEYLTSALRPEGAILLDSLQILHGWIVTKISLTFFVTYGILALRWTAQERIESDVNGVRLLQMLHE